MIDLFPKSLWEENDLKKKAIYHFCQSVIIDYHHTTHSRYYQWRSEIGIFFLSGGLKIVHFYARVKWKYTPKCKIFFSLKTIKAK